MYVILYNIILLYYTIIAWQYDIIFGQYIAFRQYDFSLRLCMTSFLNYNYLWDNMASFLDNMT